MNTIRLLFAFVLIGLFSVSRTISSAQFPSSEEFSNPPIRYWPRPLWFWNNTLVTPEKVCEQMQDLRDKCGYGGFGIVPFGGNFKPEYLSADYLDLYGKMLQKAEELDLKVSLYDEFGFPSGSVGAFDNGDNKPRFRLRYPEMTIQRLDKTEKEVTGPGTFAAIIPAGKLMGVVAMEISQLKRIDLSGLVNQGKLTWKAPSGKWKVMIFTCVTDGDPISDYLNPDAAKLFTGMVHDVYYNHFRKYFGNVIYGTFFDEPSMFHAQFRMWTPLFNEKFKKKYGFSPVMLYPALWYDIGPDTQSARNYLFGFRAELYALGFTKVVNDWSVAHGITATGHTAPEEALVPANASGDLMKSFKYLEIPGIDKIGGHRPAENFYKLVSSAAYNWDKPLIMSETYGAMPNYNEPGDLSWHDIYSIAIDQYSKGINMMIPHAVWYDNTKVTYKPELSNRNPLYADSLKPFTTFLSRLNLLLQLPGRHVADIAVLYPVDALLAGHYFYDEKGPATVDGFIDPANKFYRDASAGIDYIDVANLLTDEACRDFTFIHPEVLDEKCTVSGNTLHLDNKINHEDFKILVVPSCATISVSNITKIYDFFNAGGVVIFTTRLPSKSKEQGKDNNVKAVIGSIFPDVSDKGDLFRTGKNGGKAWFIKSPDAGNLKEILFSSVLSFDVSYDPDPDIRYIHKITGGRDIYYFGNRGGKAIRTSVILRGNKKLSEWDPHTGNISKIETSFSGGDLSSQQATKAELVLPPFHSVFWISRNDIP